MHCTGKQTKNLFVACLLVMVAACGLSGCERSQPEPIPAEKPSAVEPTPPIVDSSEPVVEPVVPVEAPQQPTVVVPKTVSEPKPPPAPAPVPETRARVEAEPRPPLDLSLQPNMVPEIRIEPPPPEPEDPLLPDLFVDSVPELEEETGDSVRLKGHLVIDEELAGTGGAPDGAGVRLLVPTK